MAELFNLKMLGGKKNITNSVYSMVSCSDLTPGSLDVWENLPDDIKYDPSLAPFKNLYEQNRGKVDSTLDDDEIQNISTEADPISGNGDTLKENEGENDGFTGPPQVEDERNSKMTRKLKRATRTVKLAALIACWILLTISLLLNREKTDTVLHTAVIGGQNKEYALNSPKDDASVLITMTGPFLKSGQDNRTRENLLQIWLHRAINIEDNLLEQNSTIWEVYLQDEASIDFAPSETESRTLYLDNTKGMVNKSLSEYYKSKSQNDMGTNESKLSLRMYTSGNCTVPLTVTYIMNPLSEEDGIIYSTLLLCCLYILIIFDIVNRTIAALLTSSLGIAVLALAGERPSLTELMTWLDTETLLLLFSMMILVAILAETGLFDFLAVLAFEVTGGRTWPLINCLSIFTAVFSTFLDNVTTVLLMTPVTIRLCEVMQLNPIPVLMSMVIFSNVGGAATPVGDPPNVIIASHPSVLRENINFTTFTLHMGVGIVMVCVQTYIQLRYMFRDMNKLRNTVPADILEMRQEVSVWRRAAASLTSYSRDEDIVKRALEKKVERLNVMLKKREAGGGTSKSDPVFCSTLAQMKLKYRIRDKQLLIKSVICITFVVIVFFLHAFPQLQSLSLGWTALLGALLLLLLAERDDLEPILARVEWSTLLFFAALFVLMEALSKLGMISWIGRMTENVILKVNEESRLAVAILLVLWVSGIASAFVDNIPLTTMMVRVTATLADGKSLGLPLAPLVWALSFGACLGGNGTLIGASANVVCAGVAEQHGYRFTFLQYIKIGFPIMMGNLTVASLYLLLCHCVFKWH